MTSLCGYNLETTLRNVSGFLSAPHPNLIVDENLDVTHKSSIYWCWLSLLAPFYRFFGSDVYSHVRVDRVAQSILNSCLRERARLENNPILIQMVKEEIFNRLNTLTHNKYEIQLNQIADRLTQLEPRPPANYLTAPPWPSDPSKIGMTSEQMNAIAQSVEPFLQTIRENPFRYTLEFEKESSARRKLKLIDYRQWNSRDKTIAQEKLLPLSLYITKINDLLVDQIFLFTKKVVGTGTQTKVRLIYNLLTGKCGVRKKCNDTVQKFVCEYFFKRPPARGIVPVWHLGEIRGKSQSFEALYSDTLFGFIEKRKCTRLPVKLAIIGDLLSGLADLHKISHANICYRDPSKVYLDIPNYYSFLHDPSYETTGCFFISHNDLKPVNILIRNEGKTEAVITDFGGTNPLGVFSTVGYRSPEKLQKLLKPSSNSSTSLFSLFGNRGLASEMVQFTVENGRKSDVWSMGLIVSMILVGQSFHGMCPLNFLIKSIETGMINSFRDENPDRSLAQLTQSEVDQSIDLLNGATPCSSPDKSKIDDLWVLVKRMLRVNPNERITAQSAFTTFSAIAEQTAVLKKSFDAGVD